MINDRAYWRSGLGENYYSLVPRRETSQVRCVKIKSYASLIMVALFYGITPDPISPFLIASVLESNDVLYDSVFMTAVAPLTRALFQHWPVQDTQLPPADPSIVSLLSNLLIEVLSLSCV